MQFFNDIISFLKTLSFVDIVFFLAVLALMLLIITLIYFIKENNEEDIPDNHIDKGTPDKKDYLTDIDPEILNLKEITEALENAEQPETVGLSKYEEEQEEKAIISYEELIKRKQDFAINYSEEENIDEELTIKKVDLDNLINKEVMETSKINVTVISYEKEEAFLKALKTLQQKLN